MEDYLKYIGAGVVTIGALSTALLLKASPQAIEPLVDLNKQSIVIPGPERAHKSCLLGSQTHEDSLADVTTLHEAFKRGARLSDFCYERFQQICEWEESQCLVEFRLRHNGRCIGWRPDPQKSFSWLSYNDVLVRASHIGAGLILEGQKPQNTTHIGIYSQNNPEFFLSEQACYMYSMVLIPLYDTLGPEAASFIVNQAEISLVICDKNSKMMNLLRRKSSMKCLRTIVCVESPNSEVVSMAEANNVKLIAFHDLVKSGEKNPHQPVPCKSTDVCIICYTSGTTGIPKGAILTHYGMVSTAMAGLQHINFLGCDDVMISYLPLAHSYERFVEISLYLVGGSIGFFSGDVKKLMDDIKILRPTIFPSVPRLLNRMYDKILERVNANSIKKIIFNMALTAKSNELKRGIVRNDSFWDKLVFRDIQQSLGGRTKLIATGSAPLSSNVLSFLRCVVGCVIVEGYGQTETHGVCSLQHIGDREIGEVGPPLPCCYIKLVDIPEMNYFSSENKGEICVKGKNVFKGYYKDEERTRDALDDDGWLHTGDVGEWLSNGTLKIIDRKKNIFKLAQGEYIAPEKIENIYIQSTFISQIFVHGDSLQAFLVAVCVPDEAVLSRYASTTYGLEKCSMAQMAQDPRLRKDILDDLTKLGKDAGLTSFEQVKSLHIHPELMTVENGLLTPTMKVKRKDVAKYFHLQIENMYNNLTK